MGLRTAIPTHMLELGMDQQAYNCIKWYADHPEDKYDLNDMKLHYLSYWGKDRSAPIANGDIRNFHPHLLIDFVIKFHLLKLLQDKEAFQILLAGSYCTSTSTNDNEAYTMMAGMKDIWKNIYSFLFGDNLSAVAAENRSIAIMEGRLQTLMDVIDKTNNRILRALLYQSRLMSLPTPQYVAPGDTSEAYVAVKHCKRVIKATPGAIQDYDISCKDIKPRAHAILGRHL